MKRKILVVVFMLSAVMFFGCFADNEKTNSIEACITNLESAINNHDYEAFLGCFADSSNYQDSFTQGQFDSTFPSGTTYDFDIPVIISNIASCSSTKSSGGSTYQNTFTMAEESDGWYIEKWVEDGTIIWMIPVRNK